MPWITERVGIEGRSFTVCVEGSNRWEFGGSVDGDEQAVTGAKATGVVALGNMKDVCLVRLRMVRYSLFLSVTSPPSIRGGNRGFWG